MEIKIKLQTIVIEDKESGRSYKVRTLRTAEEIAGYIEESEKNEIASNLEQMVIEEIKNHK